MIIIFRRSLEPNKEQPQNFKLITPHIQKLGEEGVKKMIINVSFFSNVQNICSLEEYH